MPTNVDALLWPRQNCVTCPAPEPCNCPSGHSCVQQVQTCSTCAQNVCVASTTSTPATATGATQKASTSAGALAGAVIACVVLLLLVILGIYLWRRRVRAQEVAAATLEKNISPFDLNGPPSIHSVVHTQTPTTPVMFGSPSTGAAATPGHGSVQQAGDVRIFMHSNGSIDLDKTSPNGISNPFNDTASMTTMSTNVIPIAYVPPASSEGHSQGLHPPPPGSPTISTAPSRPARAPGMDLRLPDPAATTDRSELMDGVGDLRAPKQRYAMSTRSGYSGISNRSSIISTSSSVLHERPMIVTSARVGRQILGVVRAEVVAAPSAPNSPSASSNGFGLVSRSVSLRSRPSIKSPLAGRGYTAGDMEQESVPPLPTQAQMGSPVSPVSDPFSDNRSPKLLGPYSPRPDAASFPLPESRIGSAQPSPTSMTGTVPEIPDETATSPTVTQHAQYPPAAMPPTAFSRSSAMKHFPRESQSSFVSSTSRADSIMNGFAFFPPTPPLPTQYSRTHSLAASSDVLPDESHADGGATNGNAPGGADLARRATNYSVMSSSSAMSSGLEAFTFQFGSPGMGGVPPMPESTRNTMATGPAPSHSNIMAMATARTTGALVPPRGSAMSGGPQRASLDTLVLSRDVDEFALPYDR